MSKIKLLNNETINKIAAGEVIDTPASIVKELLENSIDANSKNITIEIKDGGKSLIRVTDDGHGISSEDLDLAFKRHSTSKLQEAKDLYNINSLGFRGEALASISAVSKVEVMTKTNDDISGTYACFKSGELVEKKIIGAPKGTTIISKDLFYNFPVRKKFFKSDLIESNRISDIVYKIIIGHPNISFTYIKDNKLILKTKIESNYPNHIYAVLGKELKNNLIELTCSSKDLSINLYMSNNQYYRGNRAHQYIYINGRYIKDESITRVIEKKYKELIPINRFPAYILFLNIDPSMIDVNIHPTKQEIKFTDLGFIIDSIDKLIGNKLIKKIEIPQVSLSKKNRQKIEIPSLFDYIDKNKNNKFDSNDIQVNDLREANENYDITNSLNKKLESTIMENNTIVPKSINYSSKAVNNKNYELVKDDLSDLSFIGRVFNTYILLEDLKDNNLFFIDQHAAHERVMYEKYLKEFKDENVNTQQLLYPVTIDLTSLEYDNLVRSKDFIKNLGFDLDLFGEKTIIIRGVPIVFGNPDVKNLFLAILDNLGKFENNYDLNLSKVMKIACVNSVKSGDKLSELEVFQLYKDLISCNNPYTCPHGRPTIIKMSKRRIEKEFLRIM